MIGRGRHSDVYLYEVTEQDLLFDEGTATTYRVGNVLIFGDKRTVNLGSELACAEDLAAAQEYLAQREDQGGQQKEQGDEQVSKLAALTSQIGSRDESLRNLTEKIEQRDELLRDLSESLKSQKQDNELLHALLEQARARLAVDELRHNELVDDLQHVSKETHTIESTLERVMDEKFRLEQELAERITELVELDLQNVELRRQLFAPSAPGTGTGVASDTDVVAEAYAAIQASSFRGSDLNSDAVIKPIASPTPNSKSANDEDISAGFSTGLTGLTGEDPQVLTMASGKKIHILHEFPTAPKQTPGARVEHAFTSALRIAAIILIAVFLLGSASVIATAQVNDLSYGAALDLLIKSIGLL
jgi:hypothetical protein